jgi:hypothetical protein
MISLHLHSHFWWPHIIEDIKWYVKTCHECQVQQTCKLHIPLTIPIPGRLFWKAHIDTMKMPKAGRFEYLVPARCALTSYLEWHMLHKENTRMLCAFIFEELLCRMSSRTNMGFTQYMSCLIILKPMVSSKGNIAMSAKPSLRPAKETRHAVIK